MSYPHMSHPGNYAHGGKSAGTEAQPAASAPWADPADPNQIDFGEPWRQGFQLPEFDEQGYPINPYQQFDHNAPPDRGALPHWGNNAMTELFVVAEAPNYYADNPNEVWRSLLVLPRPRKPDEPKQWSLPQGFRSNSDQPIAPGALAMFGSVVADMDISGLPLQDLYYSYSDGDERNGRHAWVESKGSLVSLPFEPPYRLDRPEALNARWVRVPQHPWGFANTLGTPLLTSHADALQSLISKLNRYDQVRDTAAQLTQQANTTQTRDDHLRAAAMWRIIPEHTPNISARARALQQQAAHLMQSGTVQPAEVTEKVMEAYTLQDAALKLIPETANAEAARIYAVRQRASAAVTMAELALDSAIEGSRYFPGETNPQARLVGQQILRQLHANWTTLNGYRSSGYYTKGAQTTLDRLGVLLGQYNMRFSS